jgi:hypothetical protein
MAKLANYSVVLLGLLLAPLFACNTTKRETGPESAQPLVQLAEGDYLSSAYIDTLKSTRSPLKAGKTAEINLVVVRREGNKLRLEPIFNFHEGGIVFAMNKNGSVSAVESGGLDISSLSASVVDARSFRFGFGEFKPTTYVFVKNVTEYIAQVVLVGKYHDPEGRIYEFREDGWAVFPDRRFRFEIGVDHVLTDFDYFTDTGKIWAFKRNGDQLQIFATSDAEGFDQIRTDRPPLSLLPAR